MFDPRKLKRYYTTEELGEAMLWTVQQLTPEEKAKLRRRLRYEFLTKAEKRRIN
jgi:hypothetical protein